MEFSAANMVRLLKEGGASEQLATVQIYDGLVRNLYRALDGLLDVLSRRGMSVEEARAIGKHMAPWRERWRNGPSGEGGIEGMLKGHETWERALYWRRDERMDEVSLLSKGLSLLEKEME